MSALVRTISSKQKTTWKRKVSNLRDVGVMWQRRTKDGERTFFSGKIVITQEFLQRVKEAEYDRNGNKSINFVAFANTDKVKDTAPDFHIMLETKKED